MHSKLLNYTYNLGSGGLTCEDKNEILRVHNQLRELLALGQVHNQPKAKNMRKMVK